MSEQFTVWYFPEGKRTVFSARKGVAVVSAGAVTLTDLESNELVRSFVLTPDLVLTNTFGMGYVVISSTNGQKYGRIALGPNMFYFFNPRYQFLTILLLVFGPRANRFRTALRSASQVATPQIPSLSDSLL